MKHSHSSLLFHPFTKLNVILLLLTLTAFATLPAAAQVRQLIQVKTFDEQLKPLKNVEVSINNKDFISTGNKGEVFVELLETDVPVKTIKIKNEQYEPAAWNLSKSILEIVVRKKNYQVAIVTFKDRNNAPVSNLPVTFKGRKTAQVTTDAAGKIEIPLALDEKINTADQFTAKGYDVVDLQQTAKEVVITVEAIKPVVVAQAPTQTPATSEKAAAQNPEINTEYFKNFNLANLDSIQSLTVFYAIFKNVPIKSMDAATKAKLDGKFNQLVTQLQDSASHKKDVFMGNISDSSFVSEDIKNLLKKATLEGQGLTTQKNEFDEKIRIIDQKLQKGLMNLDENTRATLFSDLIALEQLLASNESRFYKNVSDYRLIISGLKEKYFDFQKLENQLSESEARRLEEQLAFRKQIFAISLVVIGFAILIVLLITFSGRLRRQKKDLVRANEEVRRVNENLEAIVQDRTKLLEEANRELDTFLYRASHDLRSPVCSIIGLCNIAIHLSNGEPKELVERVVHTTEGMDKLLKKLSIISEINQPTGYSSITLLSLVENVQDRFSNLINEKGVKFTIDCPADLVFFSYPNLVDVVITNLVENALIYSLMQHAEGASVVFQATIKDDQLHFSVRDNGIGVEASIQPRLFDMFFKGHPDSKGNGLGLYIVQKSVQALDGNITVASEQGRYTEFVVQLPLNAIQMGKSLEAEVA
ncbi:Signal transduction histidine kinase [Chryseolinea serpens]|uniref:histidine kinase n=1 Tax=Chryseolinea serpens TaxID=947013 RepID=A0A1M5QR98_9BACT|nr:HAMP domain-containing sensor histidine kinase [Chryseolinea serpens]SHH16290.1 Signal transduction histidine kinase [Chryseolinea serpens]